MNSMCLFKQYRYSTFSRLKPIKELFFSTKVKQMPIVPKSLFLRRSSPHQVQCRAFWESFPATNPSLHKKDGLDRENNDLVYRSSLFYYAFYSQFFSITAFAVQIFYSSHHAYRALVLHEVFEKTVAFGPFTVTYDLASYLILTFFTCQNFLLFYIAQRALLRVYYNEASDDYTFVTLSYNPFKSRLIKCAPGELKSLNRDNILAMLGNYSLKGFNLFVRLDRFKNAWHFNRVTDATFS